MARIEYEKLSIETNEPGQLHKSKKLDYAGAVEKIASLKDSGKRVIFVQGVFDIFHDGHLQFLREAKLKSDILIVGIENDESVRKNKGEARPIHTAQKRADLLSELVSVDYVFVLEDELIYWDERDKEAFVARYRTLNPTAVAVSSWDPYFGQIQARAGEAGVPVMAVHAHVPGTSSSGILGKSAR